MVAVVRSAGNEIPGLSASVFRNSAALGNRGSGECPVFDRSSQQAGKMTLLRHETLAIAAPILAFRPSHGTLARSVRGEKIFFRILRSCAPSPRGCRGFFFDSADRCFARIDFPGLLRAIEPILPDTTVPMRQLVFQLGHSDCASAAILYLMVNAFNQRVR